MSWTTSIKHVGTEYRKCPVCENMRHCVVETNKNVCWLCILEIVNEAVVVE